MAVAVDLQAHDIARQPQLEARGDARGEVASVGRRGDEHRVGLVRPDRGGERRRISVGRIRRQRLAGRDGHDVGSGRAQLVRVRAHVAPADEHRNDRAVDRVRHRLRGGQELVGHGAHAVPAKLGDHPGLRPAGTAHRGRSGRPRPAITNRGGRIDRSPGPP